MKAPLRWFWLCAALFASAAGAQDTPDATVAAIISAVGTAIEANAVALRGGEANSVAQAIIRREVAPHVDFAAITRQATGKAWQKASEVQQTALVREFTDLMVHVLSRLLVTNQEDKLQAQPLVLSPGATDAVVRVAVARQRAAPAPPMLVTMRRGGAGWKMLEMRTDGVDIVQLYSANFAVVIERDGGIEGLIRALSDRNARNAAAAAPRPVQK